MLPRITVDGPEAYRGQLAIRLDDDIEAVLADDGGARSVDPAGLDGTLRPEMLARFGTFLERASAGRHEVRCYDDALAFVSRARD